MQAINTNNDTYAPSYGYTQVTASPDQSTTGAGTGRSIQAGGNPINGNTIPPLEPKGSFPDAVPRNGGIFGLRDELGNRFTGIGEGGYTPLPTPQVPSNVLVPPSPNYPSVSHFPRPEGTNPDGTVGSEFDRPTTAEGWQPPQSGRPPQNWQPPQSGQENHYRPNGGFLPPAQSRTFFQLQDNYIQPVQVWHTLPPVDYNPEINKVTSNVGPDGKTIDFGDLYIPKDGKYTTGQLSFIGAYNKYINPNG